MIFRVLKNKNYTVMSNFHLKEKNMSLKAKGLLCLMLSLPENWDFSISGLVAICKENETSIKTALDELRSFGYLKINKKLPSETKSGRIEYEYLVYESNQGVEKQGVENQGVEIQGVENQGQLNIDNKNNNKYNIDYKYIINYLNEKAGTKYKHTPADTQKHIRARFADGFTIEDFIQVIDNMVLKWKGTEWEQYLRPKTLFGTKFENYLNIKNKTTNNLGSKTNKTMWEKMEEMFNE